MTPRFTPDRATPCAKTSGYTRLASAARLRAAFLALGLFAAGAAMAQEALPLWEAGAGVSVVDFPHYRGSDQRHTYALPLPYFIYRGDVLKVDRQGLRSLLFDSRRVELDLSVNGSVPVDSADNRARQGMDDLDPTLEIGPSLNVHLAGAEGEHTQLDLRLPLRAVIASNFRHVRDTGWIFQPQLNLDIRHPFGAQGWNLGLAAGPIFSDRRYNDYFYGVSPADATVERPAYRAGGGYAGTQFIAALSKRFDRTWFGAFIKADTLRGAVFEDSPLVKQRTSLTAGVGFAWIFAVSDQRVAPQAANSTR
jgi:MipA family protein